MINSKLSAPKSNMHFLASSHFKIGKEPLWMSDVDPLAYKSTFQQDYPPKYKSRTDLAKMPPSAKIMHKDDTIYQQCSVSHSHFVKKNVKERSKACQSLTQTNFKMDKDDRVETFHTTQASSYKNLKQDIKQNSNTFIDHMKSHIPQGDPGKEGWPESDYKKKFYERVLDRNRRLVRHNKLCLDTIQGDSRSHEGNNIFCTTNNKTFCVYYCPPKRKIPNEIKYPKTMIPSGDKLPFVSSQRSAFVGKFPSASPLFNRNEALKKLQKTSFKNGDNRWDYFHTTNQYYSQQPGCIVPKEQYNKKKTEDFVDSGNFTAPSAPMISSTRSHYNAPPKDYQNVLIDGSNFHTASDVCFGTDKESYYTTTIRENFPCKVTNYKKADVNTCTSSIPFDYYKNLVSDTSYSTDFSGERQNKKLVLNQKVLTNLITSHIDDPIKGFRGFNTTNRDTFTPKQPVYISNINVGRLQRSSVPLGTLSRSH